MTLILNTLMDKYSDIKIIYAKSKTNGMSLIINEIIEISKNYSIILLWCLIDLFNHFAFLAAISYLSNWKSRPNFIPRYFLSTNSTSG